MLEQPKNSRNLIDRFWTLFHCKKTMACWLTFKWPLWFARWATLDFYSVLFPTPLISDNENSCGKVNRSSVYVCIDTSGFKNLPERTSRGPFYKHGLNLIPAWISNCTHNKVWDKTTYPFPNFNGCTVEVWEWINNFIPHVEGWEWINNFIPCIGVWNGKVISSHTLLRDGNEVLLLL